MAVDKWNLIARLFDVICELLPENEGVVFYATKGKGKWDRRRHYLMIQPEPEISGFHVKAGAQNIINCVENYENK
jgi:hypothetical protein